MNDAITSRLNAEQTRAKEEAERVVICNKFVKGELAFSDAFYALTNKPYYLTPRIATAYLAGAKLKETNK